MPFGSNYLHNLLTGDHANKPIMKGLCDRELNNPEGAVFDLCLDRVFEVINLGRSLQASMFLGVNKRYAPEPVELSAHQWMYVHKLIGRTKTLPKDCEWVEDELWFVFYPGHTYSVMMKEYIDLNNDIRATFRPRLTLCTNGLNLMTATASPGYHGTLTYGLANVGPEIQFIAKGARIAFAEYDLCQDHNPKASYKGQWQGGRAGIGGTETQI